MMRVGAVASLLLTIMAAGMAAFDAPHDPSFLVVRQSVGLMAAWGWALWLMVLIWGAIARTLPGPAVEMDRPMLLLLGVAGMASLVGITWGWPVLPWAPDELWPSQVLGGLSQRFGGGWFDLYPPGHFYVLSLFYSPLLLLDAAGWLPVEGGMRDGALHLLSRLVSTGMALGVIALVARLCARLGGRECAWPAAFCASASLPFVFYARLANLDVPYLFWFCLSLLWFQASVTAPSARHVIGFAATGMAAIVTKDQAYALYVLPALWLVWRVVFLQGGIWMVGAGTATAAVVFVVGHNLLFNAEGFAQHLASITGGGSQGYEMVSPGFAGLVPLAGIVASQLWWMLGVPGLVLCIAGVWFHRTRPWIPGWVWLFPLSYLLLFVAVVGYSYDRFLLPVSLVLGLLGGAGLRGLLRVERSRFPRVVAAVCVVWLIWRVASVDALQLRDSRYTVERWLSANVPQGAVVATVWQAGYLPNLKNLHHREIEATPAATVVAAPAYVVVNTEFMNRYAEDTPVRRWWRWLQSSEAPYREVYRVKRDLRWTELAWWPTFNDRTEAAFTNLDKANPEIVVFAHTDGPGSR